MTRKGSDNLKPQNTRTKAEQRRIASAGGRASGVARREKKSLRQRLELLLAVKAEGADMDTAEAVTVALIEKALSGDVRAYEVIRDTIGEKPTDKLDNNISGGLEIAWKS